MNRYNPHIHRRRSIRLKGYDYTQKGLYFITICVRHRQYLFGNIVHGTMIHNDAGRMVENEWLKLPKRFTNIRLHEYIVMPNHFHAILEIVGATLVVAQTDDAEAMKRQPQSIAPTIITNDTYGKSVGDIVGAFQSIVTVEYIRGVKHLGWQPFHGTLWQRNYWEHIIRNERAYRNNSQYIVNNPAQWENDRLSNV